MYGSIELIFAHRSICFSVRWIKSTCARTDPGTLVAGIFVCILTAAVFVAPWRALAQCQPISALAKPASVPQNSQGQPEFFDEPQFTVAGVTDPTNLGGHGSNTVLRTKETLAKDVASLGANPKGKDSPKKFCRGSHQS